VMAEADKAPVSLGTSTSSAIVRAPPTPTRVPARVMCQGLNEGQVSEAATFYTAGRSLAWIAARYDVSHTTVAAALRRRRVQLRPRPDWI
jgi:hypothetical protein